MRSAPLKAGARYFTNRISMAARLDGNRAAAELALRLLGDELRKLPRLARLAMSSRSLTTGDHPTGYSDEILQAVRQLPIDVRPYLLDADKFQAHIGSFPYPKAYAAGPLNEGGNRENKLLEYFITLEILDIQPRSVIIDVASEHSIFPTVVRQTYGATVFREDLIYPPGVHGDRIGGNAARMPVDDEFADALVLHNSFEHFEGTSDTDFVAEAWRVLKPGGVVLIVPLFLSEQQTIVSDPLMDRRGMVWDPGARAIEITGRHNRFARFYDGPALERRILQQARQLGYDAEILHFANVKDVHPRASTYFALVMRKPGLA